MQQLRSDWGKLRNSNHWLQMSALHIFVLYINDTNTSNRQQSNLNLCPQSWS